MLVIKKYKSPRHSPEAGPTSDSHPQPFLCSDSPHHLHATSAPFLSLPCHEFSSCIFGLLQTLFSTKHPVERPRYKSKQTKHGSFLDKLHHQSHFKVGARPQSLPITIVKDSSHNDHKQANCNADTQITKDKLLETVTPSHSTGRSIESVALSIRGNPVTVT
jgi:hypothetical protein